jgi:hypothetical protein
MTDEQDISHTHNTCVSRKIRKLTISRIPPKDLQTLEQCRQMIADRLYDNGFTSREVTMFLAGATMLGHLQKGGSHWGRIYLIQKHFSQVDPMSMTIESCGKHEMKTGPEEDPYGC